MKNIKFEHLIAFAVLVILSAAMVLFRNDPDIVNIVITAFVGSLSAITAYFFTKHNPNK